VREVLEPHGIPLPTLVSEAAVRSPAISACWCSTVLRLARSSGAVPPLRRGRIHDCAQPLRDTSRRFEAGRRGQQRPTTCKRLTTRSSQARPPSPPFRLGYLDPHPSRGAAERLYWACCESIASQLAPLAGPAPRPREAAHPPGPWPALLTTSRCFRSPPTPWANLTSCSRGWGAADPSPQTNAPTAWELSLTHSVNSRRQAGPLHRCRQVKPLLELHEPASPMSLTGSPVSPSARRLPGVIGNLALTCFGKHPMQSHIRLVPWQA